jgi:hypothetical protein
MIIAMVLCLIKEQRGQPQTKRVSITASVIDICRPAHSNVDGDSSIVVPQRPREAFLSCKIASLVLLTRSHPHSCCVALARQPSPDIRLVSRFEDTSRSSQQTGSHGSPGLAKLDLDLEAQLWKPSREKRNAKAERPYSPFCDSTPVELPISPPPSYSQINKSLLVAAL